MVSTERLLSNHALLALVCGFSALIAFKPSEPFLVSYMHCIKQIPSSVVLHIVFPVWTYAYLGLLPLFCVLAEMIGYRTVVLGGVFGRIITLVILLAPQSDGNLALMQISQVGPPRSMSRGGSGCGSCCGGGGVGGGRTLPSLF